MRDPTIEKAYARHAFAAVFNARACVVVSVGLCAGQPDVAKTRATLGSTGVGEAEKTLGNL